ncbi:GAF domain-containing protein [bacterium]|nr:GAF domain-containing protein [bacterium]
MTANPTSRHTDHLEVLYKISNIINTTLDRRKVLKAVLKEVVRITGATSGSIAMLDVRQGILNIETAINIPRQTWKRLKLQLGVGVTGWVAYTGKPLRIDDVRRDSHYVAIRPDVRSELAVPLILEDDLIGVINVDSTRKAAFTEDDERMLVSVANQSARVIETARLYEELQGHTQQMESLFGLGKHLSSPAPIDAMTSRVVREGRKLLEADACLLFTLSDDGNHLVAGSHDGIELEDDREWVLEAGSSPLAPVIKRGRSIVVEDVNELNQDGTRGLLGAGRIRSFMAVPVTFGDQVRAVLLATDRNKRNFPKSQVTLLNLLATQCAIAMENASRQERLAAMEDRMHQAERLSLLGTLAAEIAHEIRNPVTIINLLLHGIAEATEDNKEVANDLSIVREKIDRINRIVDQTLSMSKDREPQFEMLDPNHVVNEVLMFLDYKFAKAGIDVKTSFEEDLPPTPIDRGQIQQVLLNLLMNAMQAMGGKGKLTVRTHATVNDRKVGPCVQISIRDTGGGIAAEEIPALFDPFFTTRAEGTGLGLFISNKMVKAHKGEIRVKSRVGRGSTFTILLPQSPKEVVEP